MVEAERILDRWLVVAKSLAQNPERGSHPRELLAFGLREYRQIVLKPWRVIYGVEPNRVIVYVIADGRRDMRTLLAQRLLGPSCTPSVTMGRAMDIAYAIWPMCALKHSATFVG